MKSNRAMQRVAIALCICAATSSARAHHSHARFYDACKPVTIEGQVDSVQWKDPHILLDLKLDDGRTYHAEWISLREVTTRPGTGPAQGALTFGARVVVMGYPLRDAAQIRASYPAYKDDERGPNLIDVAQVRRADNSWSWQLDSHPACNK